MKKSGGAIFLNVLGIFASVILSIIFVICAFALPVYYSVAGMLQPKTLTTVIQNIDYVEIIKQSPEVNKVIEDIGVDSTAANDIIKSKEVGKLLEDCTGKLTEILGDKAAKIEDLDASFLQGLVDEHIDDILNVVDEKTEIPISKEDIKTGINNYIENSEEVIEEAILELEPVKQAIVTYDTITETVQRTLSTQFILIAAAIEVIVLALIYLMRKENYGGFIWIAVNTGIVGVLVTAVTAVVSSGFIKEIIATLPSFATGIVDSAVGAATTKLTTALITCFVIMVLSIVAVVVLRVRKKKSEADKTEEIVLEEPTV